MHERTGARALIWLGAGGGVVFAIANGAWLFAQGGTAGWLPPPKATGLKWRGAAHRAIVARRSYEGWDDPHRAPNRWVRPPGGNSRLPSATR